MLADEIKLTKGTCLLIAGAILIVNFLILFAAVTWIARDRQAELNAVQIGEARNDVQKVSDKVDELTKTLGNQAIKDAEIKGRDFGYRMGQADKQAGHK